MAIIKNPIVLGGIDVSDADATASDVLSGKTFYAGNKTQKTGTIQTYSGATTITQNGTVATASKYVSNDITVNVPTHEGEPIEISTSAGMDAVLIAENVGKVYRYTGTTDANYTNGDLYEVEASS